MVAGSRANTVPESNHKNHMMACQRWEELQPCISPARRPARRDAATGGRGRAWRGAEGFPPQNSRGPPGLADWRREGRMPERGRKDAKKRGRKAGACSSLCSQGRAARLPAGALGAFRGQSIPATGSFCPPAATACRACAKYDTKKCCFLPFLPRPPSSPPSLHKRHEAGLAPAARAVGWARGICWPGVILKVTFLWP